MLKSFSNRTPRALRVPASSLVLAAALFAAEAAPARPGATAATFADVEEILGANCGSCHTPSGRAPTYLEDGKIFEALVNQPAKDEDNAKANADGLKLVVPGDTAKSLLYLKITGQARAKQYGKNMPPPGNEMGIQPLSAADINVIRRWILAGAPKTASFPTALASQGSLADARAAGMAGFTVAAPVLRGASWVFRVEGLKAGEGPVRLQVQSLDGKALWNGAATARSGTAEFEWKSGKSAFSGAQPVFLIGESAGRQSRRLVVLGGAN